MCLHSMNQTKFNLIDLILALPRSLKRIVALVVDMSLCVLTVWFAYYLRLGEFLVPTRTVMWVFVTSICLALPIFIVSGLYRAIFRFNGAQAIITVARAVGIYGVLFVLIFTAIGISGVPRTVGIIQPILLMLFVGTSRAFARYWLGNRYQHILKTETPLKVLIYGAGITGRQLAAAIANSNEMQVLGFLDDDEGLQACVMNGLPIYSPADLQNLVPKLAIGAVLLSISRLERNRRNEILDKIRKCRVAVRTLPSLSQLAQGKIRISDLHELDVDDILDREPVKPIQALLAVNVQSKVVLVTGAGGSIGSELCRQILSVGPSKLLLIEQSEFGLYVIHQELEAKLAGRDIVLIPILASVQDGERMREIISTWKPDTIYHAAAYKHVPLVEHNPAEGISNNVFGTLRTAQAAAENGVSNFVLISTDKAVRPTNIMGASKRLAEMVLQALSAISPGTRFSMVRFGNVLASSGSVVPKFRQQIRAGGPISVTHADINRYFMTIPEAAQLVMQAGAMSKEGGVFVLDMGQPVKIIDLARKLIELSGLLVKNEENPEGDIEIEITGLRPGEKLYEELLIGENSESTLHPSIMQAKEELMPWSDLGPKLNALEMALKINDVSALRLMMQDIVSGYIPNNEIVDWVFLKHEYDANNLTPNVS